MKVHIPVQSRPLRQQRKLPLSRVVVVKSRRHSLHAILADVQVSLHRVKTACRAIAIFWLLVEADLAEAIEETGQLFQSHSTFGKGAMAAPPIVAFQENFVWLRQ